MPRLDVFRRGRTMVIEIQPIAVPEDPSPYHVTKALLGRVG